MGVGSLVCKDRTGHGGDDKLCLDTNYFGNFFGVLSGSDQKVRRRHADQKNPMRYKAQPISMQWVLNYERKEARTRCY